MKEKQRQTTAVFVSFNAQSLTVATVRDLLGANVGDLKLFEADTPISDWLNKQDQSDLDTLGLGLTTTKGKDVTTVGPTSGGAVAQGKNKTTVCVKGDMQNPLL